MHRLSSYVINNQIYSFLIITIGLSLFAFILMFINPKWQTPENFEAIPIWVLAVWSPSVAAIVVWLAERKLTSKLMNLFSLNTFSPWLLVLFIPLSILGAVLFFHTQPGQIDLSKVPFKTIGFLLLLNLFLGPLGEEAGWRGFFFPALQNKLGWMGATLVVASVWTIWHSPLWLIKSPQSEINFWIFTGHVFCYSVLMSILFVETQGSLLPVILFHLLVNAVSGYIVLLGTHSTAEFYRLSFYYYFGMTLLTLGLYELLRDKNCSLN